MADKTLFFAFWPSHRQREQLRQPIRRALSDVEGNPVNRRNWHITLVYIGGFPEEKIPDLLSTVATINPGEIRLRFDSLTYWQRPKVACMHARIVPPALEQLVKSLQQALITFNYEPDPRGYRPHITVVRKVRTFREVRLARPIELSWKKFELLESVRFRGQLQYHPVKQ